MEINKEFATLTLPDKESLRIPVITDNMVENRSTFTH